MVKWKIDCFKDFKKYFDLTPNHVCTFHSTLRPRSLICSVLRGEKFGLILAPALRESPAHAYKHPFSLNLAVG
jgi:hypothetical protein